MRCPRCQGLLQEMLSEISADATSASVDWMCLGCGCFMNAFCTNGNIHYTWFDNAVSGEFDGWWG